MTLQFHQGPDGPYWVRPRYRREDYLVDPNLMRAIESERGGYLTVDDLTGERDGPFAGWEEIKRFDRDGKYWVRLRQSDADYCVDVAVTQSGQVSLNYLAAAMRIADDCGHGHDPTSRYVHRGRQAV